MTTASFEPIVRDVVMQAPHCPEPTALNAVRLACIDFCRETLLWTYTSDPQDVYAGEPVYDVESPSGAIPVVVTAAWHKDRSLSPLGQSAQFLWSQESPASQEGTPRFYTSPTPTQIELSPIPDKSESQVLTITAAVQPSRTATSADDKIVTYWADALTAGALFRVYLIPNQPFTNAEQAKARYAMYRQQLTRAKIAASKASTLTNLSVKPRRP